MTPEQKPVDPNLLRQCNACGRPTEQATRAFWLCPDCQNIYVFYRLQEGRAK